MRIFTFEIFLFLLEKQLVVVLIVVAEIKSRRALEWYLLMSRKSKYCGSESFHIISVAPKVDGLVRHKEQ